VYPFVRTAPLASALIRAHDSRLPLSFDQIDLKSIEQACGKTIDIDLTFAILEQVYCCPIITFSFY
jgi:hypothetical protein